MAVKVQVLEPFIGNSQEVKQYGCGPNGIIPHALHHPISGNLLQENFIEVTPERANELEAMKVVRRFTAADEAARKAAASAPAAVTKPVTKAVEK